MTSQDNTGPMKLGLREAQLGRATALLIGLSGAFLGLAAWLVWTRRHDPPGSRDVLLPIPLPTHGVSLSVVIAALALGAATFTGLAALHTAAAMRVLSPARTVPGDLPKAIRRLRHVLLAPRRLRQLDVPSQPAWATSALPGPEDLPPPGVALRLHLLVPAHDEEVTLGATLDNLRAQTRAPDQVTVIADNCTDRTVEIALSRGVEVVETVGNTEKKAGALNQVLKGLLTRSTPTDVVMVMDADSTLEPRFIETAMGLLEQDPGLMAVGGLFYGEPGAGILGQCQRNEFSRYQRLVGRRLDRVFVLTGTAALVRAYAMTAVAEARSTLIPGRRGQVYDTLALTEDNELTMALKSLGARLTSPPQCRVTTEIMTTRRDLWRQRLRWQRGALENIGSYGLTRATVRYWGQQIGLAYGVVALYSYFALLAITLLAADSWQWSPLWVAIGMIFMVERVATVWTAGRRARWLALPILPELVYSAFLQAGYVTSFWQIITGRRAEWNYVSRPPASAAAVALPLLALPVVPVVPWGVLLPTAWLATEWYETLCLWVAFNTLVFAFLSLLTLLPPLSRKARIGARAARREARAQAQRAA